MALIKADRVKETSTSTGTGDFTLNGAVAGYRAFSSVMATDDTFFYTITHSNGLEWETGYGKLLSSTSINRTFIHSSSNANLVVSFSAGTKEVFISLTALQSISGAGPGATTSIDYLTSMNLYLGTGFLKNHGSLQNNSQNVAIGHLIAENADSANGTFFRNVAIGHAALRSATSSNIDSGTCAVNVAIGYAAADDLNSGSGIFIGNVAGQNIKRCLHSIFIGQAATALNSVGDDNCIVIGNQTTGKGPNTTTIGNVSNTDVYLAGNVIPTGAFKPASIADSSAPTNAIYYSTTAGKLVYKDSSGTVNNLY